MSQTQLFIHHFFRRFLTQDQPEAALELASHFEGLTYFPHALEVLLHDVLDEEADSQPDPDGIELHTTSLCDPTLT